MEQEAFDALITELRRRLFDECHQRIIKCVGMLTEEQVWWRPNDESNSIGNLILHLEGNVRQWVIAGIGNKPDTRTRQAEFDARGNIGSTALLAHLSGTMTEVENVMNTVTPGMLLSMKPVQTFEESVLTILIHVTEHFAYHTGQIAYITKLLTANQLGFYDGIELE